MATTVLSMFNPIGSGIGFLIPSFFVDPNQTEIGLLFNFPSTNQLNSRRWVKPSLQYDVLYGDHYNGLLDTGPYILSRQASYTSVLCWRNRKVQFQIKHRRLIKK